MIEKNIDLTHSRHPWREGGFLMGQNNFKIIVITLFQNSIYTININNKYMV
jgi:hypothetical protein